MTDATSTSSVLQRNTRHKHVHTWQTLYAPAVFCSVNTGHKHVHTWQTLYAPAVFCSVNTGHKHVHTRQTLYAPAVFAASTRFTNMCTQGRRYMHQQFLQRQHGAQTCAHKADAICTSSFCSVNTGHKPVQNCMELKSTGKQLAISLLRR